MGTMDFEKCNFKQMDQFGAAARRWNNETNKMKKESVSKGPRNQASKKKKRK